MRHRSLTTQTLHRRDKLEGEKIFQRVFQRSFSSVNIQRELFEHKFERDGSIATRTIFTYSLIHLRTKYHNERIKVEEYIYLSLPPTSPSPITIMYSVFYAV